MDNIIKTVSEKSIFHFKELKKYYRIMILFKERKMKLDDENVDVCQRVLNESLKFIDEIYEIRKQLEKNNELLALKFFLSDYEYLFSMTKRNREISLKTLECLRERLSYN